MDALRGFLEEKRAQERKEDGEEEPVKSAANIADGEIDELLQHYKE